MPKSIEEAANAVDDMFNTAMQTAGRRFFIILFLFHLLKLVKLHQKEKVATKVRTKMMMLMQGRRKKKRMAMMGAQSVKGLQ